MNYKGRTSRVLFILKYRENYGHDSCYMSSGLFNSARFIHDMLCQSGVDSKLVQVNDNNDIDREVHEYNPSHVIIEALWVVPEKFEILHKLHPHVDWVIRIHSELPFLANEGVAIDWLCKYVQQKNVYIAANSTHALRDLRTMVAEANPTWRREHVHHKCILLPNYYPHHMRRKKTAQIPGTVEVACFGAVRPLKNQLIQAMAAIKFAKMQNLKLRFHINGTRVEQAGDSNRRNLEALFAHTQHELVEHEWYDHHEFLRLLTTMDIGMQVSFSETFNIVAADMVTSGLPIVTSPEIPWVSRWIQADPTDTDDIVLKMLKAWDWRLQKALLVLNLRGLKSYCENSKKEWLKFLEK